MDLHFAYSKSSGTFLGKKIEIIYENAGLFCPLPVQ